MLLRYRAQHIEIPGKPSCIDLPNSVSRERAPHGDEGWSCGETLLYTAGGERKYLNSEELRRFVQALQSLDRARCLFGLLLTLTGARVSEVLALTAASFQVRSNIVTFRTLKRRKLTFREVPIPRALMAELDQYFGLRHAQCGDGSALRPWPFSRVTAWRFIKEAMERAQVYGRMACPRGLRHAFGVSQLQSGTQLNVIQKWMGHARLSTTAIYANVVGPEELQHARRYWETTFPGFWAGAPPRAQNVPRCA